MTVEFLYILFSKKTNVYVNLAKVLNDAGRSDVVRVLKGSTGL